MARRFGIGVLTAGLLASMASASQAGAADTGAARGRPAPTRVNLAAVPRGRAASQRRTAVRTGVISGVVRSMAGATAHGACVIAQSHSSDVSARTGPEGQYLLGGLRPGRYRIGVGSCASASHPVGHTAINVYWTSGPASVIVRAGQVSNPAPISAWHLDLSSVAASAKMALPASAVHAKRGTISGRVTGNGRPLRGVCAAAVPLGAGPAVIVLTSKTGRYRITRLRPGRYDVAFVAGIGPCLNKGDWLFQWYPGVNSLIPTKKVKTVRVRAGKDTSGIDGHLKKGGEISGTVRAKSGKALPGICANAFGSFQGDSLEVEYTLVTDKAGHYAARGLFPAGYQVEFTIGCGNKGNYSAQWWRNTPSQAHAATIRITGTRHVTNINATLLPAASVSGVVKAVNATGKPLARVCAVAFDRVGDLLNVVETQRDGSYRLLGLSAGHTTILFDPTCDTGASIYLAVQRKVTLAAGQNVTGFNAYLPVGGGISGVVTDAHGQPLGGVCVQVSDDNSDLTRTRPDGHYSLIGVENGSFQLQFFGGCGSAGSLAPQFYPNSPTSLLAQPVRFRQNTITPNINATMQPGGTLTGVVTDTAGHPLSRICVSAFTAESPPPFGFFEAAPGPPGSVSAVAGNGKYVIANLAPGAYGLSFGCGGYGTEFFPSQVNQAAASLLSVNAGTTRVPVTRLSRAGAITGTVTSKAGKPPQFVCVQVAPAGNRRSFFPVGFTITGQKGHYRIGDLAPARYLIQFLDCSDQGSLAPQWYRRESTEAAATAVKVLPGRTDAGINGVLSPGGTVTGLVRGPTGKPANAICVIASSQQAQTAVQSQTGRSGRYRVSGLSTGRWSLSFAPCGSPKPDVGSVTRPGTVRVTAPHTVTGVNIKLPLGGSVSGRITSQASGKPIGDVCVQLLPVRANGSFGFTVTDGHGRYVASHLEAGSYRALIGDPGCDDFPDAVAPVAPQWYKAQPTQAMATAIHVSAGTTTAGIDGALTAFGSVTGTVETRAHAPVSGECVTAVPFDAPPDPVTGTPASQEVAVTGRTGGFTLTALMPGRYKIEFSTGCGAGRFATQWWPGAGSAASAKVITVRFAAITGIDATLRR